MNFITDLHAFSLYPVATFIHHKAANSHLTASTTTIHPAIEKYTKRGFEYIRSGDEYEELFQPYVNRRVGDKYTWIVDLNPNTEDDELYFPVMANTWRLIDMTTSGGFWLDAGLLRSSMLDESYSMCSNFLPTICPDAAALCVSALSSVKIPNRLRRTDEHIYDTILTLT